MNPAIGRVACCSQKAVSWDTPACPSHNVRFYAVRNHYCPSHGNDKGKQVCQGEETRHQKRKADFVVAHKEGTTESRLGALSAHGAPDSADATQADQPLTPTSPSRPNPILTALRRGLPFSGRLIFHGVLTSRQASHGPRTSESRRKRTEA